jgi:hypothetical protein
MKNFGYTAVITANYNDGSTFELERYEYDSLDQVINRIIYNRSHYATVIKDHISADDGIRIVIRVFKLNNYGIPRLVFLEECDVDGTWSGWSEI